MDLLTLRLLLATGRITASITGWIADRIDERLDRLDRIACDYELEPGDGIEYHDEPARLTSDRPIAPAEAEELRRRWVRAYAETPPRFSD